MRNTSLETLAAQIEKIMRAEKLHIDPTAEMTRLEAHIAKQDEIFETLYADADVTSTEDPCDKIERSEEAVIRFTGRNYAGRIVTTK